MPNYEIKDDKMEEIKKIENFKMYANELLDCEIIKDALKLFIRRKLINEKYFCPKQAIDDITIESANKTMGGNFKDYKIKDNTKDKLLSNLRNYTLLDYSKSKAVIYYILSINLSEDPNKNKINLSNSSYAEVIRDLIFKSQIIKEELLINEDVLHFKEIKLTEINNVAKFVSEIEKIYDNNTEKKEIFFRGHSNINYNAIPSIFRNEYYYNNEYEMYRDLILQCSDYFEKLNTRFDILSFMQHYGLPTRLLDVTTNALIALYFACENTKGMGEVEVFIVDKESVKYPNDAEIKVLSCIPMFEDKDKTKIYNYCVSNNNEEIFQDFVTEVSIEKKISESKIKDTLTRNFFVIPKMDNARITRQKGAFVLFGISEEYNKIKGICKYKSKEILYIKSGKKKNILKNLHRIGIDKSFVYPEIDDVASYLKEKYSG